MSTPSPLPFQLSGLDNATFEELRSHLETLAMVPENRELEQVLTALLLDRCLRLLRRGPRNEIAEECLHLSEFLESPPGEALRRAKPELYGGWGAFADLLAEAAGRSAPDAVDSVLRSHRGRGQEVLEILAEQEEPTWRSVLRVRLGGLSESQLSHLLRDLEECELIVRHRPEGSKEVLVELGALGCERIGHRSSPPQHREATSNSLEVPQTACLHELFATQAARVPTAEALVVGKERFTYWQLEQASNRLAHHLRALGVGPEVAVAICTERGAAMVVGILGVLSAGGAYVPLDPTYPTERLAFNLAEIGVSVLLIHRERPANLPETRAIIVDLAGFEPGAASGERVEPLASGATPDNLAYVIFTSGSTGRPKGVAVAHRSTAAMLRWAAEVFPPRARSGVLAATSICFDLSVFEFFLPLTTGGRVILAQSALELPKLAAAGEVTLVNTVPSAIAEITEQLPESVEILCLAGEPLARELLEKLYMRPGVRHVYNLYSCSEATTYSTFARLNDNDPALSIGRPITGCQAKIFDHNLNLVPEGNLGELMLGGTGLSRGYCGRPGLTAARFVPDPSEPCSRLFATGDLARYRPDGVLELLGRLDHQVKVRGFRIELGEIESALLTHKAVAHAVAVARGQGVDRHLVAYVVPRSGAALPPPSELLDFLTRKLPAFMLPAAIGVLDLSALTPSDRIDRAKLPLLHHSNIWMESTHVPPKTEVEKILADIWCEVLEIERVGIHDNFFELGGHSLKVTKILSAVRDHFGVNLPLRRLFEYPTIVGLSEAIDLALMEDLMEDLDEVTVRESLADVESGTGKS